MSEERGHPIAPKQSVEHLRAELRKGIVSLDRGEGQELDMGQVIRTAHAGHTQIYHLSDALSQPRESEHPVNAAEVASTGLPIFVPQA